MVVGECIYCRTKDPPLRREHLIAAGLNGPWVLQKASCRDHEKVTSAFEGHVLGGPFRLARAGLKMHSGHGFPTTAPLLIHRGDGQFFTVDLPVKEYPVVVQFEEFLPPAYLDTRPYTGGIDVCGHRAIHVAGPEPNDVGRRLGAKQMRWKTGYPGHSFPRLIAKIAYTFLVADVGLDGIESAYVLPAIRGDTDDIGRWVGCDDTEYLTDPAYLHAVAMHVVDREVFMRVRLFASYGAPEYAVVVGRLTPDASRGKFSSPGSKGIARFRTLEEVRAGAQPVPAPFLPRGHSLLVEAISSHGNVKARRDLTGPTAFDTATAPWRLSWLIRRIRGLIHLCGDKIARSIVAITPRRKD
jgi:hypothetical protein